MHAHTHTYSDHIVGNFQGNKFLKFLFENFKKIFLKTQVQLVLNTSVVPFKNVFWKFGILF